MVQAYKTTCAHLPLPDIRIKTPVAFAKPVRAYDPLILCIKTAQRQPVAKITSGHYRLLQYIVDAKFEREEEDGTAFS